MLALEDITFLEPVAQALGITNQWVIIGLFFALTTLLFLVLWICALASKSKQKKHIADLGEYITGLEAMTQLPPLHTNQYDAGDSIVFASAREMKRARTQRSAQPAIPPAPQTQTVTVPVQVPVVTQQPVAAPAQAPAATQQQNVTAAVHEAIYASVSGIHKAVRAEEPAPVQAAPQQPVAAVPEPTPAAPQQPASSEEEAGRQGLSGRIPRV